jgi:hypothetical protein
VEVLGTCFDTPTLPLIPSGVQGLHIPLTLAYLSELVNYQLGLNSEQCPICLIITKEA